MYERPNIVTKTRDRRVRTQHSYVDEISIEDNQLQYNYEDEQFQPIPETIEHQVPTGLYRRSENQSISSIFKHIQTPVNYQQKTDSEIVSQKQTLEGHVKFLNGELNEIVKKKMNKIEQGFSRKVAKSNRNNSRLKYNQWDDNGIDMQITNNHKLLMLLRQEYQYLKGKLTKCEQSDHKIKCQNQIIETKQNLSKMKSFLVERKRKNVLAGKKISQVSKRDLNRDFFDLQQQYITLSKKKQQYTKKIDKINQDNANLIEDHSRSEDRCIELKRQAIQILSNLPNQFHEQHNKVMYDTKCRKMQLSLRKRQRDEENYKRKYYGLLKDYQLIVEHLKQLDQKLKTTMQQAEAAAGKVKDQSEKIQQIKQQRDLQLSHFRMWKAEAEQQKQKLRYEEEQDNENNEGFMLTQLSNKKTTSRATKRKSSDKNKYKTQPTEVKPKSLSNYNYRQLAFPPLKVNTEQHIPEKDYHRKEDSSREQSLKNSRTSQVFKDQITTQKITRRVKPLELAAIKKQQDNYSQIQQQIQCSDSFDAQSPAIE